MLQKGLSFPKPLAKSRGQVKKLKIPPLQKEGGGQELNANVNGLANLETLQVGNFESHVKNIKQLLSLKIQCFKAGNISNFYSTWLELTSDPEVLYTVKGQSIEFTTTLIKTRSLHKRNLVQRKAILSSVRLTNYVRRKLSNQLVMSQGNLYLLYFLGQSEMVHTV